MAAQWVQTNNVCEWRIQNKHLGIASRTQRNVLSPFFFLLSENLLRLPLSFPSTIQVETETFLYYEEQQ